jgi:twinkle protein
MAPTMKTLADYGISLRRRGNGEHKTLCPECSATRKNKKDPCLSVKVEGDAAVWNCHNCGWTGATGRLYNAPRKEYKRPTYQEPRPDYALPDKASEFFRARGISPEVVKRNRITIGHKWFAKLDREAESIQFPFYRDGVCVNIKHRGPGKCFAQESGAEKIFYGMDDVPDDADTLIIVEGEMDKLACNEAGLWNVVSVPDGAPKEEGQGTGAKFEFVDNCVDFLATFGTVVLATDGDGPGRALREELARRVGRERCAIVDWPLECKDANDTLQRLGAVALAGLLSAPKPYPVAGLYSLKDFLPEILDTFDKGIKTGVSTGWKSLDELYTVPPAYLTVVTGHPGSGKSEFLDAMTFNMAKQHGMRFVYCSLENSVPRHGMKLVHRYHGCPPTKDYMTHEDVREAIDWAEEYFQFISPGFGDKSTIEWALERAGTAVRRRGVQGVVLDPYNRFFMDKPSSMPETEWINQKLEVLLRFTREHGVHMWFIAHPRKPVGGFKEVAPGLSEISGSMAWYAATDFGLSIHREYDQDIKRRKSETEVHVKKVRSDYEGSEGMRKFEFDIHRRVYTPSFFNH